MSKQVQTKLYELLYSWEVSEFCEDCQHMTTYRDNDNRHPCAQCQSWNRFKIDDNLKADLNDKVNEILTIVNNKKDKL